ncbi:macro domain-containing protein [Paenibacillus sacheonensis]|uniref:RNase III inhibitor n=1 Tax=Paenibacillus sacheonensis TaxID=742054 RepID=A0A7X4YR35_9BACL|nr:macro domain-containing protein [Paenibacillus sacheonensis]MBM7567077.1 O-acetyl-ADP-ribose deacetylase (regulator of RNase III) [Paenibacillus sacheonensis]NBC70992.1 RNase III inhibitor [Paenibacillus sacheonensis]
MPFTIVRNDITAMHVDAIVNAANTSLQMGGGVCGAIFRAAGARELQQACERIGGCEAGQAVATSGFKLPATYIIHTPGPVWRGGSKGEETLLRDCYGNALRLAAQLGCESVAFPLISSGLYGYPKAEALRIASGAIQDFLLGSDMDVYLAVFDKAAVEVSEQLLGSVEAFIDEHYVSETEMVSKRRSLLDAERRAIHDDRDEGRHEEEAEAVEEAEARAEEVDARTEDAEARAEAAMSPPMVAGYSSLSPLSNLEEVIERLDEPFALTLLRLIDAKGRSDVEVYKRANIDRKLFSKIRSNSSYMPSKKTAIALAVALALDLAETADLLERAGYALSRSQKFDVIIEYFILQGQYDLFAINEVLFHYDQPLLGS